MRTRLLSLTVVLAASSLVCKADPFGIASGFSLVALGTTGTGALAGNIHDGSEVTGRVAAAGEIFSIGTIGSALTGQFPDPFKSDATFNGATYDLIAGGGLGTNVTINSDGDAFANPTNGNKVQFNGNGGTKGTLNPNGTATDPINFDTLRTSMQDESEFLGNLVPTGTPIPGNKNNNNKTVLNATDPTLDVFTVTAAEFASGAIDIETHGGNPTVIVNVTGSTNGSYTSGGVFLYNGQQDFSSEKTNKVLFNFPDATTLNLNNGEFAASVLAPFANLTAGTLDGTIIVGQVASLNGEVHNIEFDGTLPPPPVHQNTPTVPEPGTLMLVGTGILSAAGAMRRRKNASSPRA